MNNDDIKQIERHLDEAEKHLDKALWWMKFAMWGAGLSVIASIVALTGRLIGS